MKKLTFIALLFSLPVFAQSNVQARFKDGDKELSKFLNKIVYQNWKSSKENSCVESETFARFIVNEKGEVGEISFYERPNTPVVFRESLAIAIKSTNGKWMPRTIKGKPVKSRPLIVPLFYSMEAGCAATTGKALNLNYISLDSLLTNHLPRKLRRFSRGCILMPYLTLFSSSG